MEQPHHIARNARYGLVLFVIYVLFYAAFVWLSAFRPAAMAEPFVGGVNLAICYGFGLIIAAFVLALTYRSYRLTTEEEVTDDPEDTRVSHLSSKEATALDEDRPQPRPARDTDLPDELDALPGLEGSK